MSSSLHRLFAATTVVAAMAWCLIATGQELPTLPPEDNREQPAQHYRKATGKPVPDDNTHRIYCVVPAVDLDAAYGADLGKQFIQRERKRLRCSEAAHKSGYRQHCIVKRWVEYGLPKKLRDLTTAKITCFKGNAAVKSWLLDPVKTTTTAWDGDPAT